VINEPQLFEKWREKMGHDKIIASRKTGNESFTNNKKTLGFSVEDFWKWSVSDLLSNATRGRLAEFIVATALGINVKKQIRDEWSAWDLTTPKGIKVEVKSAAYIQSWHQKESSKISFLVPKTRAWDADTNKQADYAERHADVYVLALLEEEDVTKIDPMKIEQWSFFVIPTYIFNERERSQHSITLPSLEKLIENNQCEKVYYQELKAAIIKARKNSLQNQEASL
jgi:hypothetical protein